MPKPRCGTLNRVIELVRGGPRTIEFLHQELGGDRRELSCRLAKWCERGLLKKVATANVRVSFGNRERDVEVATYGIGDKAMAERERACGLGGLDPHLPTWLQPRVVGGRWTPKRLVAFDEEDALA